MYAPVRYYVFPYALQFLIDTELLSMPTLDNRPPALYRLRKITYTAGPYGLFRKRIHPYEAILHLYGFFHEPIYLGQVVYVYFRHHFLRLILILLSHLASNM